MPRSQWSQEHKEQASVPGTIGQNSHVRSFGLYLLTLKALGDGPKSCYREIMGRFLVRLRQALASVLSIILTILPGISNAGVSRASGPESQIGTTAAVSARNTDHKATPEFSPPAIPGISLEALAPKAQIMPDPYIILGLPDLSGNFPATQDINTQIVRAFDQAKAQGLKGRGVIIPQANLDTLSLRPDIVHAITLGLFRIYLVDTLTQATAIQDASKAKAQSGQGFDGNSAASPSGTSSESALGMPAPSTPVQALAPALSGRYLLATATGKGIEQTSPAGLIQDKSQSEPRIPVFGPYQGFLLALLGLFIMFVAPGSKILGNLGLSLSIYGTINSLLWFSVPRDPLPPPDETLPAVLAFSVRPFHAALVAVPMLASFIAVCQGGIGIGAFLAITMSFLGFGASIALVSCLKSEQSQRQRLSNSPLSPVADQDNRAFKPQEGALIPLNWAMTNPKISRVISDLWPLSGLTALGLGLSALATVLATGMFAHLGWPAFVAAISAFILLMVVSGTLFVGSIYLGVSSAEILIENLEIRIKQALLAAQIPTTISQLTDTTPGMDTSELETSLLGSFDRYSGEKNPHSAEIAGLHKASAEISEYWSYYARRLNPQQARKLREAILSLTRELGPRVGVGQIELILINLLAPYPLVEITPEIQEDLELLKELLGLGPKTALATLETIEKMLAMSQNFDQFTPDGELEDSRREILVSALKASGWGATLIDLARNSRHAGVRAKATQLYQFYNTVKSSLPLLESSGQDSSPEMLDSGQALSRPVKVRIK